MWVSVRACVRSYVVKERVCACVRACARVRAYPHSHAHTHTHTLRNTHIKQTHELTHAHTHLSTHTRIEGSNLKGVGAYQQRWEVLPSTYVGFFIISHRDTYTHAKFAIYFLIRVTGARIILPLNITSQL